MKFGRTYEERLARQNARRNGVKFLLFPRQLDSGRWAWFERVPYRAWVGAYTGNTYRDYLDVPKGNA